MNFRKPITRAMRPTAFRAGLALAGVGALCVSALSDSTTHTRRARVPAYPATNSIWNRLALPVNFTGTTACRHPAL